MQDLQLYEKTTFTKNGAGVETLDGIVYIVKAPCRAMELILVTENCSGDVWFYDGFTAAGGVATFGMLKGHLAASAHKKVSVVPNFGEVFDFAIGVVAVTKPSVVSNNSHIYAGFRAAPGMTLA